MEQLNYRLVRSNRKSVEIQVDRHANVIVRAPQRMPQSEIDRFIREKQNWIQGKQTLSLQQLEAQKDLLSETIENVMYLGSLYPVREADVTEPQISGRELLIPKDSGIPQIRTWMQKEAARVLTERVRYYIGVMQESPAALRLSNARTRWGTCSWKNHIGFSWRLIMCPPPVLDYVVVHELSHIRHKNHSAAFWARIQSVLPDYQEAKVWLREHQYLMDVMR